MFFLGNAPAKGDASCNKDAKHAFNYVVFVQPTTNHSFPPLHWSTRMDFRLDSYYIIMFHRKRNDSVLFHGTFCLKNKNSFRN